MKGTTTYGGAKICMVELGVDLILYGFTWVTILKFLTSVTRIFLFLFFNIDQVQWIYRKTHRGEQRCHIGSWVRRFPRKSSGVLVLHNWSTTRSTPPWRTLVRCLIVIVGPLLRFSGGTCVVIILILKLVIWESIIGILQCLTDLTLLYYPIVLNCYISIPLYMIYRMIMTSISLFPLT